MRIRGPLVVILTLSIAGCGDSTDPMLAGVVADTGDRDGGVGAHRDVRPDAPNDDASTGTTDTGGRDAPVADAPIADATPSDMSTGDAPDTAADTSVPDATSDSGGPDCDTIAQLRALPEGDVELEICDVVVTWVTSSGFFLQTKRAEGPAVFSYEGDGWDNPDGLVSGDTVTIPVTEFGSFRGTQQIVAHGAIVVTATGYPAQTLFQNLSSGIAPSEELESEVVEIRSGVVRSVDGENLLVDYGTAAGVAMRVADGAGFCVGATFRMVGVVTEWEPDGVHRVQSFDGRDFASLDTEACTTTPPTEAMPPGVGDLVINEFLADPAPDLPGDANCDGVRDSGDDEFVEIVNVTDHAISLEGVSVSDEVKVRHAFATDAEVAAGDVVVVFGGGDPGCSAFSGLNVQLATDHSLGFNNGGDTLTLALEGLGAPIDAYTYVDGEAENDESLTLSPDLAADGPYVGHTTAAGSGGAAYSPGTRINGATF